MLAGARPTLINQRDKELGRDARAPSELPPLGWRDIGWRAFEGIQQDRVLLPGPVLVEAVVDPHEPPMPPKITLAQAAKFAEALVRGTPQAGRIALTVASDKVRELI